ncbi:MAG: polysaccharide deacetylase family protein [Sphingobacteriales bacterium]|nr:polysaccharide deacetylase family protein [Sphingobacteriales bacterium]OJY91072.1 MAG: hypothetical protein BGP14_06685 [Sphingobacteriales bacterium 44-15]
MINKIIFLRLCVLRVVLRYGLSALALSTSLIAQCQPPRLIVRGDDMGFSHSGNLALIRSYNEGIERSVEVIVPSPWFPEAVRLLKENPGVDAGIHLCLSSEWENIKWRPVSFCPSLTNTDGYFYPMVWPNKNYPGQSLRENNWVLNDIEKEFRAQIELAIKHIPRISHISSHMGCTDLDPEVKALTKKLAKEYHIDIDPSEMGVKAVSYKGNSRTFAEKKASFAAMLKSLEPGVTYLFVDHPALNTAETKAIYHTGYEHVAEDRQGVTNVWTDPAIISLIKKRKIVLLSYRDLLQ